MSIRCEELGHMDFADVADGLLPPVHPGEILREEFLRPPGSDPVPAGQGDRCITPAHQRDPGRQAGGDGGYRPAPVALLWAQRRFLGRSANGPRSGHGASPARGGVGAYPGRGCLGATGGLRAGKAGSRCGQAGLCGEVRVGSTSLVTTKFMSIRVPDALGLLPP